MYAGGILARRRRKNPGRDLFLWCSSSSSSSWPSSSYCFVVIFIVVVFVIIAISLVFTFMGGSHIVDSVVLVFACFVGPVIVVIVVTMYVVCLLWFLSRRPEIRFLRRLRPPRITMPYAPQAKRKEGGCGGAPMLIKKSNPGFN